MKKFLFMFVLAASSASSADQLSATWLRTIKNVNDTWFYTCIAVAKFTEAIPDHEAIVKEGLRLCTFAHDQYNKISVSK